VIPRTVLIGLDGATFTILDPLVQAGVMPFLGEFIAAGARAELTSVIPALTPPAWTSLVTGHGPGRHGIFDFFRKESPRSHALRLVTSRDIAVDETIWSLAGRAGRRAIALNFPLTFPAPAIDGYVVPGWMPWRQLRLGCHPDGLYDRLKTLPGFNPRELAMDMTHEAKALEGCDPGEYEAWIDLHARREHHWLGILESLLAEDAACTLITVLFDGVDKLQHLLWRFIDPAYTPALTQPWEQRVRESCLDYFRRLDGILARVVQLAGPQATVIVASDHGFGPQERTFFVNAWLAQRGHLAWVSGDVPQASDAQLLGVGHIARHGYLLDWTRTQAYAPLPSGNGIHIVRADAEHPGGVSAAEYEPLRDRLRAELLELRDPASGIPVVAQVWKREDIFAGPCLELAPDLTLVLQDGGLISILASEAAVTARPQPTGTHRPAGVFIAGGPELRRGARLAPLSILDVAPLILHSLRLPIPADLEGRLPLDALEPAALQARPVEMAAAHGPSGNGRSVAEAGPGLDGDGEQAIMERLRALGYLE
jgi:predicted AlkP superfamily phosphohydrolase/phosphomutase